MYFANDEELEEEDFLTDEDWAQLAAIYYGLKPFWEITMRLQGHSSQGSHGVIWEVLPSLGLLLHHVESKIAELAEQQDTPQSMQLSRNSRRRQGFSQVSRTEHHTNPLLICYQKIGRASCRERVC